MTKVIEHRFVNIYWQQSSNKPDFGFKEWESGGGWRVGWWKVDGGSLGVGREGDWKFELIVLLGRGIQKERENNLIWLIKCAAQILPCLLKHSKKI